MTSEGMNLGGYPGPEQRRKKSWLMVQIILELQQLSVETGRYLSQKLTGGLAWAIAFRKERGTQCCQKEDGHDPDPQMEQVSMFARAAGARDLG